MKKLSLGLVVVGLIALLAIPAFANSTLMTSGSQESSSSLGIEETGANRYASGSHEFCWGSDRDRDTLCGHDNEGRHHRSMNCNRNGDCGYENCGNKHCGNEGCGNGCFDGRGQDCRHGDDCFGGRGQDCRHGDDCFGGRGQDCRYGEECDQDSCFSLGHSRCRD